MKIAQTDETYGQKVWAQIDKTIPMLDEIFKKNPKAMSNIKKFSIIDDVSVLLVHRNFKQIVINYGTIFADELRKYLEREEDFEACAELRDLLKTNLFIIK